ncbi:MAG TPA: cell wall hydrolase [Caulobacteraceae bacterium]|jgi:spore germination cell wall hydrolase CwlJ-like protein|nr:cell wall hydrolase [Caulobacteraceae bacterium]
MTWTLRHRSAFAGAFALTLAAQAAIAQDVSKLIPLPYAQAPYAQAPYAQAPYAQGAVAPFVLQASDQDRSRAMHCLTEAIYYEAGTEPREGQEAVAQVVLNRLKHRAFPKSVCGVVFEGSDRPTGCQFTFTCDGSLARAPVMWRWDEAEQVAAAALAGHVVADVGASTHYHAAWMTPYWSASMVETRRIGGHVFYRMQGADGSAEALSGQYAGREPAAPTRLALAAAAGVHGRRTAAPSAPKGVSQFSVWGLQVATVSAHHGDIVVRSGS